MDADGIKVLARFAAIAAGVATLMAGVGAFGSNAFGFFGAWAYWFVLIGAGSFFGLLFGAHVADGWLRDRPWAVRWAVLSCTVTLPMVGVVTVAHIALGDQIRANELPDLALKVALITFAVTAVGLAVHDRADTSRRAAKVVPDLNASEGDGAPAFARRLPPHLMGAEIWALSAEDHYVRAHTSKGEALILIRLADAIREMAGAPGVRVHRSWWVADAGLRTAERRGEGGTVTLRSGVSAPVSRARAGDAAARGWFERVST